MKALTNETSISKDLSNRKLLVKRQFNASVDRVWRAWTDSALLDQWWAPRPWKARTKSMNFTEGGSWFYYMEGPEGERHYCRTDYKDIEPQKSFTADDAFCDEGNATTDLPLMHWKNLFLPNGDGTRVEVEITFDTLADLEKIVEMGFQEGFTAAHSNLDELLEQ